MTESSSHLVLLPSYNTGPRLNKVVADVLRHWRPVLVVIDGSTDGSERSLLELSKTDPALTLLVLPGNSGKGAAVLAGARAARERGFTHALVMDADGQHPEESIPEFMSASRRQPEALVLGKPVFPSNIPPERLHGRKLSVGLVHFELFGSAVADPLFGFRVYPLASLLAVLGPRRGARRFDFDTEAAVRLVWSGVPTRNLDAPVRYFSRNEGGVSHFHYLRDNVTLVWMHTRLIVELLLWRWPAAIRHRRRWQTVAVVLALMVFGSAIAHAGGGDALVNPEHRIASNAPAWSDLVEAFARHSDITADFTERRFFPFKKRPVELKGEVRVSATRGLSLHYVAPEERTVVLDRQGVLLRTAAGDTSPPDDPRVNASNEAMRHILDFDLPALERDFELYGSRNGTAWTLVLVPRTEARRHSFGRITVEGESAVIRRIEMRRSAKQAIEIDVEPPRPGAPFSAAELKKFFR